MGWVLVGVLMGVLWWCFRGLEVTLGAVKPTSGFAGVAWGIRVGRAWRVGEEARKAWRASM